MDRAAATVAGLIAAVATVRATVSFVPQRFFDVDPMLSAAPASGLGPAGSLLLDVLLLALACVGFGLHWRRGGGVRPGWPRWFGWLGLALGVPATLIVLVHGAFEAEQHWAGASWIAGGAAGLAMWALASGTRGTMARGVATAALLVALVPLLVRGAQQVRVGPWMGPEHAETLQQWESQRASFLADRGWAEDSASAQIFERRLRQPQPTGWFTTTNIFATVAGAGGILAIGLAAGMWRDPDGRAAAAGMAVLGVVPIGLVGLSGSKGALAAIALAAAPLFAWCVIAPLRRWIAAAGPWAGVGVIVLALAAVVVRGQVDEDFAGDRSLLFRWHYMQGAAGVIADAPLAGEGAAGFQAAYVRHRPERSPEEVASPHSVFIDWLAAAGLPAIGWAALFGLAAWMAGHGWRSGQRARSLHAAHGPMHGLPPADAGRPAGLVALAIIGGGLAALAVADGTTVRFETLMVRGGAVVAAGILAMVLGPVLARRDVGGPALAAAAIMATVHAQIEMSFTQPGSAAWLLVLLGLAAGAGTGQQADAGAHSDAGAGDEPSSRGNAEPRPAMAGVRDPSWAAASAIAGGLTLTVLGGGLIPAALRAPRIASAAAEIAAANGAPAARASAAASLSAAGNIGPGHDRRSLVASVRQWLAAASLDAIGRDRHLAAAEAVLQSMPGGGPADLAVDVAEARWRAAGPQEASGRLNDLLSAAERARAEDPAGPRPALRHARVLAEAGRNADAAIAATEALRLDAAKSLDPAKQFPPAVRAEAEALARGLSSD
ncbi:MAG: O-antigen ligase family protein [Phycisphaerales bacterium]